MTSDSEKSPSPEVEARATSAAKRKSTIDEIEVDLTAPEPPSKRARRALKKGKPLPAKPNSDEEKEKGEGDQKEKKEKPRSEHGVWIGNLPFTVTAAELRNWLIENSGGVITSEAIVRIKLPTTKEPGAKEAGAKGKNKGFAYVDFTDIGGKVAAIALSETGLGGRRLLIKDSKSFEGRPEKAKEEDGEEGEGADGKTGQAAQKDTNASRKVFVGNMSFQTTEDDVRHNFEKCGEIEWVKVATFEDTGKCKGFGWVKFREPEAAAWAVKGFVKIKEEVETEEDFADPEDEDEDKAKEKQFKTRKWWVNRIHGRNLKLELAEDDQLRYKKRFGKDAKKNGEQREPKARNNRPYNKDGDASEPQAASEPSNKPLKEADNIYEARLKGVVVKHTVMTPRMYESNVVFTLDTICPWHRTFVAKKRLDQAIEQVRSSPSASAIAFTLRFDPFQLQPDLPETTDKQEWYLENKHMGNAEAQKMYHEHMKALASSVDADLRFDGHIGNTFHAHRVIQHFQEEAGPETANRLVDVLYRRYFCEARHPAADDTLIEACTEAGIDEKEARRVVEDRSLGERELKQTLNSVGMDVDAVPVVRIEGRRRDITLTGAKEVAAYVKALETVTKESA
ncbi:hypothetical protein B0I35DRAFT_405427 [Stachybotrys elegans]|uniref:RRM domain-containing protein n=1 Tax=Stachybotrys elegans TaxID=80388 RepID=A0A8K0SVU6_9HYPO|nr:hypothetical protein B0I35DRAFT_405427 [Stachybotrys elegans]